MIMTTTDSFLKWLEPAVVLYKSYMLLSFWGFLDCGAFYSEERAAVRRYIETENLKPTHLLCSHGHLDHVLGNGFLYQEYGLKAEVHADDEMLINNLRQQAYDMVGMNYTEPLAPIGKYLRATDIINFGNHQMEIIHTPGHTPGGVVFFC